MCMRAAAGTLDLHPIHTHPVPTIPTISQPNHEKNIGEHLGQLAMLDVYIRNRQLLQENWIPQRADNSQLSVIGISALEHLVVKVV